MDVSDRVTILVAAGVISTTLGIGSCSTNGHIADMNAHLDSRIDNMNTQLDSRIDNMNTQLDSRIDDVNARIDDVNARIDDVQADIRELRGLIIDAIQTGPVAD